MQNPLVKKDLVDAIVKLTRTPTAVGDPVLIFVRNQSAEPRRFDCSGW